jgi:hypothetical protein
MTVPWKQYQEAAASFFQRLGFNADVEAEIEGVRGSHKIDVFVTGSLHGIGFRWIVECKHWKTNIPKEKVMALTSIVQDVGADRGFLLSETGFQSGAIRAARSTNITLSSLDDLKLEAYATLTRDEAHHILQRREEIHKRLWALHKSTGDYMSHFMKPMGEIMFVDLALDEGLAGKFPAVYTVTRDGDRPTAENWDDLVSKLTDLLDAAELFAAAHEHKKAT